MRPDTSDMDHAEWLNGPEQPVEPLDYCDHGRRASTCGKCADLDCTPLTADEIEMELQRVVLKKWDEINARGSK